MSSFFARDPIEELSRITVGRVQQIRRAEQLIVVELGSNDAGAAVAVCHVRSDDLIPQEGQLVEVLLTRDLLEGSSIAIATAGRVLHGDLRRPHELNAFRKMMKKFHDGTIIQVSIIGRSGDGWLGEADGMTVFGIGAPIVDKDRRPIRTLKGDVVPAKLIAFRHDHRNFQVEWGVPTVADLRRQDAAKQLSVGDQVQAEVLWFNDGGAMVELRAKQFTLLALLPNKEASWQRRTKAKDVLAIGQTIAVVITQIDADEADDIRIHVSRRLPDERPPGLTAADISIGMEVAGEVVLITSFGAFVEIGPGVDGLLHKSKMNPPAESNEPAQRFAEGDRLVCYVDAINSQTGRISLSERKPEEGAGPST